MDRRSGPKKSLKIPFFKFYRLGSWLLQPIDAKASYGRLTTSIHASQLNSSRCKSRFRNTAPACGSRMVSLCNSILMNLGQWRSVGQSQQGITALTHPLQHLRILLWVFMDAGQQRLQPLLPGIATKALLKAALQHLQHDGYRRTRPR